MKNLSLKLPDQLHAKLEEASQRRGAAKSDVVRDALEAYLEQSKGNQVSCADLAGDLIGSLTGPPDLATNPIHMRGYGQ
jgi:metal-responsive CopG/Arc/MetJ family transcriptional regulator